jgi:hypothetical protein
MAETKKNKELFKTEKREVKIQSRLSFLEQRDFVKVQKYLNECESTCVRNLIKKEIAQLKTEGKIDE